MVACTPPMLLPRTPPPLPADDPRARQRELQRLADEVCALIVASDLPEVDVRIAIEAAREFAERHFPDRAGLFAIVYEARFERLWQLCRA
jgi:hypothetical protein